VKVTYISPKENRPAVEEGVSVLYAPSKRNAYQLRWYLILFLVSLPVLYFLYNLVFYFFVVEVSGVLSTNRIVVKSSARGHVKTIDVDYWQEINKNDVVISLDDSALNNELSIIHEKKKLLRTRIQQLKYIDEIAAIRSQLRVTQRKKDRRKIEKKEVQALLDLGAATHAEVQNAQMRYDSAVQNNLSMQRELIKAQNQLLKQNYNLDSARQMIDITQKEFQLERELKQLNQQSPSSGKILDILVSEGEFVSLGTPLVVVSKNDDIKVTVFLNPKYIAYAKKDSHVVITLPNGVAIQGIVTLTPGVTKKLPRELATSLIGPQTAIVLGVELEGNVPPELAIENLPVKVNFGWL